MPVAGLAAYAQALGGRALAVHVAAEGQPQPWLEVPESGAPWLGLAPADAIAPVAWAATAHAVAHLLHGQAPQPTQGLKPLQRILLGVLEDARVEHALLQALPGLRGLWVAQHTQTHHNSHNGFDALLARLSLALLDPTYTDPHPWIARVKTCVLTPDGRTWRVPLLADLRVLASRLGHEVGQMRLPFDARTHHGVAPYRDDNRHLWLPEPVSAPAEPTVDAPSDPQPPALAPSSVQVVWYPEWDHRIGRLRPQWCRVECHVEKHEPSPRAGRSLVQASPQIRRLARALMALPTRGHTPGGVAHEGQHLHPMAALDAHLDRLRGRIPDGRVFRAERHPVQPLAVWLLLDASRSMEGQAAGIHHLAWQAAMALNLLGHRTALWTLASNGHHHVGMQCLKNWGDGWSEGQPLSGSGGYPAAAARIACDGSSRLGTGVRHGLAEHTRDALTHPGWRRLVLVVTDGELHDIDVHDPTYLYGDLAHCRAEASHRQVALRGLLNAPDKAERFRAVMGTENCAVATSDRGLQAVLKGLLAR